MTDFIKARRNRRLMASREQRRVLPYLGVMEDMGREATGCNDTVCYSQFQLDGAIQHSAGYYSYTFHYRMRSQCVEKRVILEALVCSISCAPSCICVDGEKSVFIAWKDPG